MLPKLLAQILAHQDIVSVTADGTQDARKCCAAIADHRTTVTLSRHKNAKPWKIVTTIVVAHDRARQASKYLSRAP
jgi:hypothetical protein